MYFVLSYKSFARSRLLQEISKLTFMNLPISNAYIDLAGLVALIIVLLGVLQRIKKGYLHHFFQWYVFESYRDANSPEVAKKNQGVASSFFTILVKDVFTTRVLSTCDRIKRVSHVALFWGFVFLAISTILAALTDPSDTILPLYNPVKVFGNTGGALVVAGFVGMFYIRYREKQPIWRLTRSDFFILALLLAVVSGFATQQAVYSATGSVWVSGTFWVHMILVVLLLVTAPFTKFFHAIRKPITLLYEEIDKRSGREPLLPKAAASTDTKVATSEN